MKTTNKIIITAKEWFDKVNGHSYFAVKIELENETLLFLSLMDMETIIFMQL